MHFIEIVEAKQYAVLAPKSADLASDFGREWAEKLFGAEAIASLPVRVSGKYKGKPKGYVIWRKAIVPGWSREAGAPLAIGQLADAWIGEGPLSHRSDALSGKWLGRMQPLASSATAGHFFDSGRARWAAEEAKRQQEWDDERREIEAERNRGLNEGQTMTPIAQAVEPLRADAIRSARDTMQERINRMTKVLEEHGMDLDKVAPYPRSSDADYHNKMRRLNAYRSITRGIATSRRPSDPHIVRIVPELVQDQIHLAEQTADEEYSTFIAKLERKIGEHSDAKLDGNHVWGYSILTVTTPNGVQRWKTQQILNVSKLGKIFPQWPSRKIK